MGPEFSQMIVEALLEIFIAYQVYLIIITIILTFVRTIVFYITIRFLKFLIPEKTNFIILNIKEEEKIITEKLSFKELEKKYGRK